MPEQETYSPPLSLRFPGSTEASRMPHSRKALRTARSSRLLHCPYGADVGAFGSSWMGAMRCLRPMTRCSVASGCCASFAGTVRFHCPCVPRGRPCAPVLSCREIDRESRVIHRRFCTRFHKVSGASPHPLPCPDPFGAVFIVRPIHRDIKGGEGESDSIFYAPFP